MVLANKTIFIHIGPPKTGTSAIQNWLSINREVLLENGIFYPKHSMDENGISSGNLLSLCDKVGSAKFAVNQKKYDALIAEFESTGAEKLLLSSEAFFPAFLDICHKFDNVKFIAYLRSPLDFIESIYNQSVKRHKNTLPIKLPKKLNNGPLKQLTHYIEEVGSDKFILRAYAPHLFSENDIVCDFLSIFDLEKLYQKSEKKTNSSYQFQALEFKRWLNSFNIGELDNSIDRMLQRFEGVSTAFSLIPPKMFNEYQVDCVKYLKQFCRKFQVAQGKELIKLVTREVQKPYREQNLTDKEFVEIIDYLKQVDEEMFITLCRLIHSKAYLPEYHTNLRKTLTHGYPASIFCGELLTIVFSKLPFYLKLKYMKAELKTRFSNSEPASSVSTGNESGLKGIDGFRQAMSINHSIPDAIIYRELAILAEKNDNVNLAYYLMVKAKKGRPTGPLILNKMKKYARFLEK